MSYTLASPADRADIDRTLAEFRTEAAAALEVTFADLAAHRVQPLTPRPGRANRAMRRFAVRSRARSIEQVEADEAATEIAAALENMETNR